MRRIVGKILKNDFSAIISARFVFARSLLKAINKQIRVKEFINRAVIFIKISAYTLSQVTFTLDRLSNLTLFSKLTHAPYRYNLALI